MPGAILFKNKTSSFINIGGLTVGIAVALLIGLWIYDELSFNKYHQNYDRIGRILIRGIDVKEGPFVSKSLPYPLATELIDKLSSKFQTYYTGILGYRTIFFRRVKRNYQGGTIYG